MENEETKGGVTIPLFECIFNGSESIESFTKDFDKELYRLLPNLYGVCISDNSGRKRKIVAGFFVKTSYTHHDEEFLNAMTAAISTSRTLKRFLKKTSSFLPARLGVVGEDPLSEQEYLSVMQTQFLKHSVGGNT